MSEESGVELSRFVRDVGVHTGPDSPGRAGSRVLSSFEGVLGLGVATGEWPAPALTHLTLAPLVADALAPGDDTGSTRATGGEALTPADFSPSDTTDSWSSGEPRTEAGRDGRPRDERGGGSGNEDGPLRVRDVIRERGRADDGSTVGDGRTEEDSPGRHPGDSSAGGDHGGRTASFGEPTDSDSDDGPRMGLRTGGQDGPDGRRDGSAADPGTTPDADGDDGSGRSSGGSTDHPGGRSDAVDGFADAQDRTGARSRADGTVGERVGDDRPADGEGEGHGSGRTTGGDSQSAPADSGDGRTDEGRYRTTGRPAGRSDGPTRMSLGSAESPVDGANSPGESPGPGSSDGRATSGRGLDARGTPAGTDPGHDDTPAGPVDGGGSASGAAKSGSAGSEPFGGPVAMELRGRRGDGTSSSDSGVGDALANDRVRSPDRGGTDRVGSDDRTRPPMTVRRTPAHASDGDGDATAGGRGPSGTGDGSTDTSSSGSAAGGTGPRPWSRTGTDDASVVDEAALAEAIDLDRLTDRLYRAIEDRERIERERRGR